MRCVRSRWVRSRARSRWGRAGWMLLVLAAVGVVSRPAEAAFVDFGSSTTNGFFVDDFFSAPGLLAVDVEFDESLPVWLSVEIEDGDTPTLAFNGVMSNFTLLDEWSAFEVSLSGATFVTVGSVEATFGEMVTGTTETPTSVEIAFAPPVLGDIVLGDPFLEALVDWEIDVSGLDAGESFMLHLEPIVAPEPGMALLLASASAGLVALRSRARRP